MKRILLLLFVAALLITCAKSTDNGKPVYPTDCATHIAGAYTGSDYCSSSGQAAYACNIITNTPGNITFSNLGGAPVNAVLNCATNTVTIPTQTFPGNFSISGTGTYTANRIIINWTGASLGIPLNCSSTFTR